MKKVYICIGVAGAGKSTYIKQRLNDKTVWLSSDNIRKELYNSLTQEHNEQVFSVMRKRLVDFLSDDTKDILYYDATNLNRKKRIALYSLINHKAEVIALCFLLPLGRILQQNNFKSGQERVSDWKVKQMYKALQVPRISVDCDKIEKAYGDNFNEFKQEFADDVKHDSPYHKETVREHINMCIENARTDRLKEIAKYHDLGKFICKEFVSDNRATFKNHEFVSAMYYLAKINVDNQEQLDNMEVIYRHMNAHNEITDKMIKKYKLNNIIDLINEFKRIDDGSRIV